MLLKFHSKTRQLIKILQLSDELVKLVASNAGVDINSLDRATEPRLYFALKDFALETKVIRTYCQEEQEWLDEMKTDWSSNKFFRKRLSEFSDKEREELEEFFQQDEESRNCLLYTSDAADDTR